MIISAARLHGPAASRRRVYMCGGRIDNEQWWLRKAGSGRADRSEEAVDLDLQPLGLRRQSAGGFHQFRRGDAGLVCRPRNAVDVLLHFVGAGGGLLDIADDLAGGAVLLIDGAGDRAATAA